MCPRWLTFLAEVFDGDADLIDFVWRVVGYALTGIAYEQCLFLCCGRGANGKSIFLALLRALLGDLGGAAARADDLFRTDRAPQCFTNF